jgi:hypothetical protein
MGGPHLPARRAVGRVREVRGFQLGRDAQHKLRGACRRPVREADVQRRLALRRVHGKADIDGGLWRGRHLSDCRPGDRLGRLPPEALEQGSRRCGRARRAWLLGGTGRAVCADLGEAGVEVSAPAALSNTRADLQQA